MGYDRTWTSPKTWASEILTSADLNSNVRDNLLFLKENIALEAATELTIAAGAVTKTKCYHDIDTTGDAASSDLDTISGGAEGDVLFIRPENAARTVVVKHNTGNIWNPSGEDITLDDIDDGVLLLYGANSKWLVLGGGSASDLAAHIADSDPHTQYFLLAGETTDAQLHSGADLIVYSDAGVSEVARIDGATGNITTSGTVDGIDIAAHDIATTGVHGVGAGTVAKTADIAVDANLSVAAQAVVTAGACDVDANLSATAQAAISASHTQGTDTTLGTLTANVNFAYYKAIAMSCDNGATLPASPVEGTWFLHTPTGRKILMIYSDSAWRPIISFGTMTLYVDATDGTDNTAHGIGVDGDAFATVQYAVDTIPPIISGNVTINVNAESYAEDVIIRGKRPSGNYSISIVGALTLHDAVTMDGNGVQGATTTQASVHEHGMTANHYQNQLIAFTSGSNNGLARIIDSNTNDAGTANIILCGKTLTAQPLTNDTAGIYTWGTTIQSVSAYGVTVSLTNCGFSKAGTVLYINETGHLNITNCSVSGNVYVVGSSLLYGYNSYLTYTTGNLIWISANGYAALEGCKLFGNAAATNGILVQFMGSMKMFGGNVIDTHSTCIWLLENAFAGFYEGALGVGNVYNFIKNGANFGVYASNHAQADNTAFNSYSGCGTDESAAAAGGNWID